MRTLRTAAVALLLVAISASAAEIGWNYGSFESPQGSGWAFGTFAYDDEAEPPTPSGVKKILLQMIGRAERPLDDQLTASR